MLEKDGARVLIDPVSLPFLADAEIDFADELIGARFVVQQPERHLVLRLRHLLLDLTASRRRRKSAAPARLGAAGSTAPP